MLTHHSHSQPGKEDHAEITRRKIRQAKRAVRKITLGKFFDSDQYDQYQATDHRDPYSILSRNRAEESQVDEQSQDPIQDEVTYFVSIRDAVDDAQYPQIACICQDND